MSRLELLNVFVNERLTAAAEEIVRAVKDALLEYQREVLRSQEENERLRRLLEVAAQRLLLQQQQQHQLQQEEPEPLVLQPQNNGNPCEWRNSVKVKEEPNLRTIQRDCSHETRVSDEGHWARHDSPTVQSRDGDRLHEWMTGAERPSKVKDEPNHGDFQADCSLDTEESDEGNCSRTEPLQKTHPPPAETVGDRQSVSSPQLTSQEDEETDDDRKPASSISLASAISDQTNCSVAQSEPCTGAAKGDRTEKAEQHMKLLLCSSQNQSSRVLQANNLRSPPPQPCSAHTSQSVPRWHNCEECGKGFSFACQLEVHMRWHTKEKPYSCTVCRKSFTTVSMLKRHHRIHTGEKPFRCHVCGKCFNQSAHLNTHFRLHTRERTSWT